MLLVNEDDSKTSFGKVLAHNRIGHFLFHNLVKTILNWSVLNSSIPEIPQRRVASSSCVHLKVRRTTW